MKKNRVLCGFLSLLMAVTTLSMTASYAQEEESAVEEKRTEDQIIFKSDVISADFADYGLYTPNGNDGAKLEKVEEDGRSCLKIIPNPYSTEADRACVDGGQYHRLGVDLKEYLWVTVEYKYISDTPVISPMMIGILNSAVGDQMLLDKGLYYNSTENIQVNKWAYAIINLKDVRDHLNYNLDDHILKKMHLYPFGFQQKLPTMSENDEIYIGKIHFSTEKPTVLKANTKAETVIRDQDEIELPTDYIEADFADYGLYTPNGNDGATLEKVEEDGRTCLRVTPNPYSTQTERACVDGGQYHKLNVDLKENLWVTIEYKYVSEHPVISPMMVGIINTAVGDQMLLDKSMYYNATENLQANKWTYAIINLKDIRDHLNYNLEDHILRKIHLYPFGYQQKLPTMSENDEIYIGKIIFSTEKPKLLKATSGENIGELTQETKKDPEELPDVITLDYRDYGYYTPNGKDYAVFEKIELDGRNVIKVNPNTSGKDATESSYVCIDGSHYGGEGIDLRYYQWFALEYKYVSPQPIEGQQMGIAVMANGTIGKILKESLYKRSDNYIVHNQWDIALFDLTDMNDLFLEDVMSYDLRQLHVAPFGFLKKIPMLCDEDTMYLSKIMFFKEKPEFDHHTTYMKGYNDGTFLPGGNMTRAEACTVIARLLEKEENIYGISTFTDTADHWAEKYIGLCQEKGILKSYSGTFNPDQHITRAEFAELVFLTELANSTGNNVDFTDVTTDHPQYTSIKAASSAGLINGYPDGTFKPSATITRAEVVTVVNRALGRSRTTEQIPSDISIIFVDVDDRHWAFADIAEATVPHTEWNESWIYSAVDPINELLAKVPLGKIVDIASGHEKVVELDKTEALRITEIRETDSDLSHIKGKNIYVSLNGDDANDGLTEDTPVKTAARANEIANSGDAILFSRGELRRETFEAKSGITYSSYGNGDKPTFYASPENGADSAKWSLDYEDAISGAKIWKYSNENLLDIGAIVINNGDKVGYKDFPSYKDGQFVLMNDTAVPYDYKVQLDRNLEYFHKADSIRNGNIITVTEAVGPLYLRCDEGNPGEIFDSIEFNIRKNVIQVTGNDVVIDNLRIMYTGSHGIGAQSTSGLTVKNCEIGWIGGSAQKYEVHGDAARIVRFGNGIEVYGSADRYYVDNCYIYQCYDAGVTHQCGSNGNNVLMQKVEYTNNLITDCVYSFEYFLGASTGQGTQHLGRNILIENNILRRAGFGFGSGRPEADNQRHIRSGTSANNFENFVIKNNVFDRAVFELFQTCTNNVKYLPKMENNIYIQGYNNRLCSYGLGSGKIIKYTHKVINEIYNIVGDKNGKIYFVESIPTWTYKS